ncbi:hypothetical protein ACMS1Z_08985 [Acidiphilium multivorum]|uniref:hypothetical protein n=1 Tax=Acidiphilium multivorum TaxID=62140 RepID=UPI0039C9EDBF
MKDETPQGVTDSERFLSELCSRTFLYIWSYANPFKDDGHEFCDVLAVFENHVFIFFDREKVLSDFIEGEDPSVRWSRWKRNVVDRQVKAARGAERYLRSGRKIYLDAKKTRELPIPLKLEDVTIHKIIVAHGATEACKNFSESNIHGSLAISYGESANIPEWPFIVHLDRSDPVHIFDTHNLPIVLGTLDTIKDFSDYLNAKIDAISLFNLLCYCGEEDLLAHYLQNTNPQTNKHFIGSPDPTFDAIIIAEGAWQDLIARQWYVETQSANKRSYLWDRIIKNACDHWLGGTLLGDGHPLNEHGAIFEMAKEPRFMRREAVDTMLRAINAFPDTKGRPARYLSLFGSYCPEKAYVFLQLWIPPAIRGDDETYRAKRQEILRIACGSAKNHYPQFKKIVGICIPPPKLENNFGEDFIWLDCTQWTEEQCNEYDRLNRDWGFFETGTPNLKFLLGNDLNVADSLA